MNRVRTRVVPVDPSSPAAAAMADAAAVLEAGGVVAFPTETFYGLGVAALDAAAVRRVFALKGRPESRPMLVLVDDPARVERVALLTERARELIVRHWPGALTLVMPARPQVPVELTAGTGTIGVRQSAHPVARALAAALVPLPLIAFFDWQIVRTAHAVLSRVLPDALSFYLVFNYTATLVLLLALTYAAVPILVERQARLRHQESHG